MDREPRNLGKGLASLLGATPTVSASRGGGTLPIGLMQPGAYQPRQSMARESLEELASSIKANGVIQPIVVRPLPDSASSPKRYEIIAGERRWQAAQLAGLSDIPAIVKYASDQQALAIALIENIQREELSPADEARALKRLGDEFQLTQQQVADAVGRSRAAVANLIRLLDLPAAVIALVDSRDLSMGHARALLGLGLSEAQSGLAKRIVSEGLTVRDVERLVREAQEEATEEAGDKRGSSKASIREILRTARVRIRVHQLPTGKGKIVAEFEDAHSRDDLLELLKSYEGD